jgi:hypothetical protein
LFSALGVACGSAEGDSQSDATARVEEAIRSGTSVPPATTRHTWTLSVPVGITPFEVTLGATNDLRVNDRARILDEAGADADVAAVGPGQAATNIGVGARLRSVLSKPPVVLRGSKLSGFVRTEGSIVRMPGVLGIKRERPEAMSRADLKNMRNLQRVLRMLADNPDAPPEVRALAEERIAHYEDWEDALSGDSRPRALKLAARRLAGTIGKTLLGRYVWRRRPPDEVHQAFPGLGDG